jgi:hypothetical protein
VVEEEEVVMVEVKRIVEAGAGTEVEVEERRVGAETGTVAAAVGKEAMGRAKRLHRLKKKLVCYM